ncbi:MAG: cell division protein SepF [Clostridiales bacterium]|nr:cell division protein SepF [Clostridiales bacterium]
MGIFGKFKDLVGIEEIEDDQITEQEIADAAKQMDRKSVETKSSYSNQTGKSELKDVSKLQNQGGGRTVNPNTAPFKLVVIEPKAFDECPRLVDNLKAKKPVIVNLEKLEADTARKIFDFLGGATYALNGNVQKVSNNIFVFAPEGIDITANVEHKGIDFNSPGQKSPWR